MSAFERGDGRRRCPANGTVLAAMVVVLSLSACSTEPPGMAPEPTLGGAESPSVVPPRPFVRVVGTAQDGGLPHVACDCTRCVAARTIPGRRRLVAGLAIVLPASRQVYLVDATPDLREQLDLLADVRPAPGDRVDRRPVDGVFLTHAHVGHYLGLAFFGFEAVHTRELTTYSTAAMAAFLAQNGPWSQLVELVNIVTVPMEPGEAVEIGDGVRVTAVAVPHRDEYADTVGFRIEGPDRGLFYAPDTDSWGAWEPTLPEVLKGVDVALLDGTFYSAEEMPGRSVEEIGHPLITDSMALLEGLVAAGRLDVYFTHLNHSNPALEPHGAERVEIGRRGFAILEDGQEIAL